MYRFSGTRFGGRMWWCHRLGFTLTPLRWRLMCRLIKGCPWDQHLWKVRKTIRVRQRRNRTSTQSQKSRLTQWGVLKRNDWRIESYLFAPLCCIHKFQFILILLDSLFMSISSPNSLKRILRVVLYSVRVKAQSYMHGICRFC